MKPVQRHAYTTLLLIVAIIVLALLGAMGYGDAIERFFQTGQKSSIGIDIGILLNGFILLLFLIGLLRMSWIALDFAYEQGVAQRFFKRSQENADSPAYELPRGSLVVERYGMVQTIARQHAVPDQNTLATSLNAKLTSVFTLVRFVHNTLVLTGVFGTVVSLSLALVGAAQLFNNPQDTEPMANIIGSMSTALSTTVTALVCYMLYSYLHLRLQDLRSELQSNIEDLTMVYILPRFQVGEAALLQNIGVLAAELRQAAELVNRVQERFLQAGERLQLAVDDLQQGIQHSSESIQDIRDTLREGFRLPSLATTPPPELPKPDPRAATIRTSTDSILQGVRR